MALAWTWYTALQRWQAQPPAALDQTPAAQQLRQGRPSPPGPARPLSPMASAPLIDGAIERLPGVELVELAPR